MEASPSPLRQGIVQVQIRDVHDVNVFFFFSTGSRKACLFRHPVLRDRRLWIGLIPCRLGYSKGKQDEQEKSEAIIGAWWSVSTSAVGHPYQAPIHNGSTIPSSGVLRVNPDRVTIGGSAHLPPVPGGSS